MKKVIIIIRPNMYKKTKAALEEVGFNAFSMISVNGRGKVPVQYTAANNVEEKEQVDFHRFIAKKMIMVFIRDEDEERLIKAVMATNSTNNCGDGKIFVIPVHESIRIRTGETKDEALV